MHDYNYYEAASQSLAATGRESHRPEKQINSLYIFSLSPSDTIGHRCAVDDEDQDINYAPRGGYDVGQIIRSRTTEEVTATVTIMVINDDASE